MKKYFYYVIIGLGLALLLIFLLRVKRKPGFFNVEEVKKRDMIVFVSASGKVKAEKDVNLQFQTAGMLSWVGVKKNDSVSQWQAIASLDKRDLEKRMKKTLNDYLTNRWDFEQTQDNYKETKERKLITDAIQRILDKAQFSLDNAVLDVEIADLAVKFATIYSPFAGIVVSVNPPYAGVNILPSTANFRIVDPKSVYFEAQVDETEIGRIKTGDETLISLDAFPEKQLLGKVNKIDFESTLTSGGGTAYNVSINLPEDKESFFRLGMNGDAQIISKRLKEVIVVPLSSIVTKDKKNFLWMIDNGRAKKIEVTIGETNEEFGQIISGISEKAKFVSSNLNQIKEGMRIE